MEKVDLYKLHAAEYAATKRPALVRVGPAHYLAIKGAGAPESPEFDAKVGALYGMAYTIKMAAKQGGRDFKVSQLESLWWTNSGQDTWDHPSEDWRWKLLIRMPEFVTGTDVAAASAELTRKGRGPELRAVRLERLSEGLCVQVLHVGPYAEERRSIAALHEFAAEAGHRVIGRHHELYLSDPRRTAPEKLRTILRHRVSEADHKGRK